MPTTYLDDLGESLPLFSRRSLCPALEIPLCACRGSRFFHFPKMQQQQHHHHHSLPAPRREGISRSLPQFSYTQFIIHTANSGRIQDDSRFNHTRFFTLTSPRHCCCHLGLRWSYTPCLLSPSTSFRITPFAVGFGFNTGAVESIDTEIVNHVVAMAADKKTNDADKGKKVDKNTNNNNNIADTNNVKVVVRNAETKSKNAAHKDSDKNAADNMVAAAEQNQVADAHSIAQYRRVSRPSQPDLASAPAPALNPQATPFFGTGLTSSAPEPGSRDIFPATRGQGRTRPHYGRGHGQGRGHFPQNQDTAPGFPPTELMPRGGWPQDAFLPRGSRRVRASTSGRELWHPGSDRRSRGYGSGGSSQPQQSLWYPNNDPNNDTHRGRGGYGSSQPAQGLYYPPPSARPAPPAPASPAPPSAPFFTYQESVPGGSFLRTPPRGPRAGNRARFAPPQPFRPSSGYMTLPEATLAQNERESFEIATRNIELRRQQALQWQQQQMQSSLTRQDMYGQVLSESQPEDPEDPFVTRAAPGAGVPGDRQRQQRRRQN
ncbi:hypothetical protein F5Y16DRAFT_422309 [Xylariaceae sp. FL0255]|nr:hypothetical protein F5Y16DRAFT_422309 [Xylariaceae sp. FL0255]